MHTSSRGVAELAAFDHWLQPLRRFEFCASKSSCGEVVYRHAEQVLQLETVWTSRIEQRKEGRSVACMVKLENLIEEDLVWKWFRGSEISRIRGCWRAGNIEKRKPKAGTRKGYSINCLGKIGVLVDCKKGVART